MRTRVLLVPIVLAGLQFFLSTPLHAVEPNPGLIQWVTGELEAAVTRVTGKWKAKGWTFEEFSPKLGGTEGKAEIEASFQASNAGSDRLWVKVGWFDDLEGAEEAWRVEPGGDVSGQGRRCWRSNVGVTGVDLNTGKYYDDDRNYRICANIVTEISVRNYDGGWIPNTDFVEQAEDDLLAEMIGHGLTRGYVVSSFAGHVSINGESCSKLKQNEDPHPGEVDCIDMMLDEGDEIVVQTGAWITLGLDDGTFVTIEPDDGFGYAQASHTVGDPFGNLSIGEGAAYWALWFTRGRDGDIPAAFEVAVKLEEMARTGKRLIEGPTAEIEPTGLDLALKKLQLKIEGKDGRSGGQTQTYSPLQEEASTTVSCLEGAGLVYPNYDPDNPIRVDAGWQVTVTETDSTLVKLTDAEVVELRAEQYAAPGSTTLDVETTGAGEVTSDSGEIDCGWRCSEGFDYDSQVALTATPDAGSTFVGWSGDCSGTAATCIVKMNDRRFVFADFSSSGTPVQRFPLNALKSGTGTGLISSTPAGIDCGNDCTELYAAGTQVTLEATPAAGSTFVGWAGVCTGTDGCTVTMGQFQNVLAQFAGGAPCQLTIPLARQEFGAAASAGGFGFNTGFDCPWTVSTPHNWITLNSATSGTGSGGVNYSVTAWDGCRSGVINIYGQHDRATYSIVQSDGSGGEMWTAIGPVGTPVDSLGVHPQDADLIYAGNGFGKVYRTVNLGGSWQSLNTGLPNYSQVSDFVIASGGTVYLSSANGPDGVLKSTDGGNSWNPAFNVLETSRVECLAGGGSRLYAGTQTHGVYVSSDGGASWSQSNNGLTNTVIWGLLIHGGAVYAATSYGVAKSVDGGANWTEVFQISGSPPGASSLAADPFNVNTLYAGTHNWGGGTTGQLFKSVDGGVNWSRADTGLPTNRGVKSIAVLKDEIYAAATFVYMSTDGGASWSEASDVGSFRAGVLKADPVTFARIYAGNVPNGVYITGASGEPCKFSIDPTSVDLGPAVKSDQINVTAPDEAVWAAGSNASWITLVSHTAGSGDGFTVYNVSANPSTNPRNGTVAVAGQICTINQAGLPAEIFTLSVDKAGTGTGAVGSAPAGIECGGVCSSAYEEWTSVTLTPTADEGSVFAGWSGACTGTGTCSLTLLGDRDVTATFEPVAPEQNRLAVGKSGGGSGTVTSSDGGISCGAGCRQEYAVGTSVTLTPTPSSSSSFAGWSGDCTGTGTCIVTLDQDRYVSAQFEVAPQELYALTVRRVGDGSGIVTSNPDGVSCGDVCTQAYDAGTSVTLTAVPNFGATFEGWGGACAGNGACTVTLNQNQSVTADFPAVKISCTSLISPMERFHGPGEGMGTVSVIATKGCPWTAASNHKWLTITAGRNGTGPGTVNYAVDANQSTEFRSGTLSIAGGAFGINQDGIQDLLNNIEGVDNSSYSLNSYPAEANSVALAVKVLYGNGDPVSNLRVNNFQLKEDGVLQSFLVRETPESFPAWRISPGPRRSMALGDYDLTYTTADPGVAHLVEVVVKVGDVSTSDMATVAALGGPAGQVRLSFGDAAASPGSSVDVPVILTTVGGPGPAGFEFDLTYDSQLLVFNPVPTSRAGEALIAAGKQLGIQVEGSGDVLHVQAFGLSQDLISDGTVAYVNFTLSEGFPNGKWTDLICSNPKATDVLSKLFTTTASDGMVQAAGCDCDVNRDGRINLIDLNLITRQATGEEEAGCDLNGDGMVNVADLVTVIKAVISGQCGP